MVDSSREYIRRNLAKIVSRHAVLRDGDLIGKTHRLNIINGETGSRLIGTTLQISLPPGTDHTSQEAQKFIKDAALKALRTQAKAYLSRQLGNLAEQHGFYYTKLRFSNAGTRWGSCSNKGTISLNIWLMQLPFDLIDYVIIHELCHTRAMNHSALFWSHVESILPNYRELRRRLKQQQPYA